MKLLANMYCVEYCMLNISISKNIHLMSDAYEG